MTMILGSSNVSKLMLGTSAVQKVMFGGTEVWSAVQPMNVTWLGVISRNSVLSFTEAAFPIGAAAVDRRIFVGALVRTSTAATTTPVTSLTVAGGSASKLVEKGTASSFYNFSSAIFSADVPSGTTAAIYAAFSTTAAWVELGVWAVTGGTGSVAATATDGDRGGNAPIACNVGCGTSAGTLLACGCSNPTGGSAAAWTGIAEDHEKNTISNDDTATWASGTGPNATVYITGGQGQYTSAVAVSIT